MAAGSILGAFVGGLPVAVTVAAVVKLLLGVALMVSAIRMRSHVTARAVAV